jgi:large subunit ribosomal protein L22
MSANEGLELLKFIPRKAARLLGKTLHSAIANAENNHNLNSDELVIESAIVEEGPVFRRFKAAARGSAKPIRKRTSHLRIVLSESSN